MSTPRELLLDSPLPSAAEFHQPMGQIQARAVFSAHAFYALTHATQVFLLVLIAAGPSALGVSLPKALPIAALLIKVDAELIHGM